MSDDISPIKSNPIVSNSNVSFPPPGIVKGSEEEVAKEERFLCERLLGDATRRSGDFNQTKWISWNNPVVSVIQGMKRPVCGMVALCMAGELLRRHDPDIPIYENDEKILALARSLGFSKQGEMFSAKQYAELAREVLNCDAQVIHNTLINSWRVVLDHIAMGYPVLVPYDTDRNYEPCIKMGHKAHWAILTGFVIGQKNRVSQRNNGSFPITIFSQRTEVLEFLNGFDSCNLDLSMFYIYAKQGKSAKQQMWSLKALSASNANLIEVSPDRDCSLYEIPKEGINLTLCCQSVLLYPKQHSLS